MTKQNGATETPKSLKREEPYQLLAPHHWVYLPTVEILLREHRNEERLCSWREDRQSFQDRHESPTSERMCDIRSTLRCKATTVSRNFFSFPTKQMTNHGSTHSRSLRVPYPRSNQYCTRGYHPSQIWAKTLDGIVTLIFKIALCYGVWIARYVAICPRWIVALNNWTKNIKKLAILEYDRKWWT